MQKLQKELKNTPRNTSLVPCSVSSGLNKDQSPSDQSKVLICNNSEENQQQHRAGSNLIILNTVYVLKEKSHINDAFVIANGSNQIRCGSYSIEQKRKNNRCLQLNRKGFAPSIRKSRYKIQPKDIVRVKNIRYIVKGVFNRGNYVRVIDGENKVFNFKIGLIDNCFSRGSVLWN